MPNHTPGPWHLDGFNLQAVRHCTAERGSPQAKHSCGDWETIAKCEGATWQIAQANARLIAAAPEMLKALIAVSNWIGLSETIQADDPNTAAMVAAVDAALAKARQ